jgi:nucleolar protein 56
MPGKPPSQREVVTTWHGAFVVEDGRVLASAPFPSDPAEWADRMRRRRAGEVAPEEAELLRRPEAVGVVTRDRRLVALGAQVATGTATFPELAPYEPKTARPTLRALWLEDATRALHDAWDPAIHLEEAVRATEDLDGMLNLLGERLVSWGSRDAPQLADVPEEKVRGIARALAEGRGRESATPDLPGPDPDLELARRTFADLYRAAEASRSALEHALEVAVPRRAPSLSALLGPLLAARLIAKAGGVARLGRLPASTIQVLGAERAFFEHLRGRAPPPRHGLLFLHPTIQGAPKRLRGKLARALAGKAAIAARRDMVGAAAAEGLSEQYAARAAEIRTIPAKEHRRGRGPPRTTRPT